MGVCLPRPWCLSDLISGYVAILASYARASFVSLSMEHDGAGLCSTYIPIVMLEVCTILPPTNEVCRVMTVPQNKTKVGAAVNGSPRIRALVNDGVPGMADPLKWRSDTFTGGRTTITFEAFPDVMRAYRAFAGHCKAHGVSPEDAYSYVRKPWCKLGLWARQGLTFAQFKTDFWDAANVTLVRPWSVIRCQVMEVFALAGKHTAPRRGHGIELLPGQVTFRELLRGLDREGYREVNSGRLRQYVLEPLERDGLLTVERPERRGQAGRLHLTVPPETALDHLEGLAAAVGAEHQTARARNVLDGKVRAKRREVNVARARHVREQIETRQRDAQIQAAAYAREHPPRWADLETLLVDLDQPVLVAATAEELHAMAARRRT